MPPKLSISSFMGFLKGKSSVMIYERWGNMKFKYRNRQFWCRGYYVDTVAQILKNEVYIGNLVQGKKTSMGYKVHKFKKVPEKDWCRTENAHEPIIDIETWNKVQKRLGTHEFPTKTGDIHFFSRKVYCDL